MLGRFRFSSSVPNTYAATTASLVVGWGGLRADSFVGPRPAGPVSSCECGLLKPRGSQACHRCSVIDGFVGIAQAVVLEALADYEPRDLYELAAIANRTTRTILRSVRPLVEEGRISVWLEPQDVEQRGVDGDGAFKTALKGRYSNGPKRMYRRSW